MSKFETFLSKNRKLKLTLLYFFVATIMLLIGRIGEETYLNFLLYSLGIFSGANAIQKLKPKHVHQTQFIKMPQGINTDGGDSQ